MEKLLSSVSYLISTKYFVYMEKIIIDLIFDKNEVFQARRKIIIGFILDQNEIFHVHIINLTDVKIIR